MSTSPLMKIAVTVNAVAAVLLISCSDSGQQSGGSVGVQASPDEGSEAVVQGHWNYRVADVSRHP